MWEMIKKSAAYRQALAEHLARLRPAGKSGAPDFRIEARDNAVDVYIYDVIGWPFIEAQDLLYQIPRGAEQINVHINSPGGDVFEGMAIYNLLTDHQADVHVHVDALAASSASLIAMAGDTVTMAKASFLMIHNPWVMMSGDADELRKEADLLDKIGTVFAAAYADKCGKDADAILALMKAETWFTAEESREFGLADTTAEPMGDDSDDAVTALFDLSVFENTPQSIRQGSALRTQSPAILNTIQIKEREMNKKLLALLKRLGLHADATEDQAWEFLAGLDLDTIADPEEKTALVTALASRAEPAPGVSPEDAARISRDAITAERARVAAIREDVTAAGLDTAFADELINGENSVDQARKAILAKMKETQRPVGAGAIVVGDTDGEKFRAAVVDGIAVRAGVQVEQPAAGHETFKAASIEFIARQCLERNGVNTANLTSRDLIAREILGQGGMSTDDFSSIFLDVSNKTLLKAYDSAPATWRPLVNVVPASDFKTIYGVSLSDAPALDLIGENGEYKEGSLSDNQESYAVASYGKIIYLTRKMIVNDDLRAFTRLPQLMGAAARRKESDLVWALFTGNPTMNDGVALFHADHGNLASSAAAVGSTSLSKARTAMRKQTGDNGGYLDLTPRFLIHPVAVETDVEILLRSMASTEAEMNSGVINPWNGKLTPVSDPRLDAASATAWYLAADPAQIDTVEVAYLDGNEQPYTEEQGVFNRDALGYKVRHDFGCGVMDSKGLYKNAGA